MPRCVGHGEVIRPHRASKLVVGRSEEHSHMLLANVALDIDQARGDRRYFELARKHCNAVLAKFPSHTIAENNLAWQLVEDLGEDDPARREEAIDGVRVGDDAELTQYSSPSLRSGADADGGVYGGAI